MRLQISPNSYEFDILDSGWPMGEGKGGGKGADRKRRLLFDPTFLKQIERDQPTPLPPSRKGDKPPPNAEDVFSEQPLLVIIRVSSKKSRVG